MKGLVPMNWKSTFIRISVVMLTFLLLSLGKAPPASAAPTTFASSLQAGCYLARRDRCKIHVDPFSINVASGTKLVRFQLVTTRSRDSVQTVIYDFRTDQSNPVPFTGLSYTPSLVAKDFGVSGGESYPVSLQGMDSGDTSLYNLGVSGVFNCPVATFTLNLPVIVR